MAIVTTNDEHYKAIADKVREIKGSNKETEPIFPSQMAQKVQEVYEKGKAEGGSGENWYDTFWDSYQNKGKRTQWNTAFNNNFWTDTTYNPKYHNLTIEYAGSMFSAAYITDTRFSLDFSTLRQSEVGVFRYCRQLVTIRELTVSENLTFQSWFGSCTALKNISFNGTIGQNISFADSSLLTNESVQSIIDHLADLTGKPKQTLTLDIGVTVSEEQQAKITGLNWSLSQI